MSDQTTGENVDPAVTKEAMATPKIGKEKVATLADDDSAAPASLVRALSEQDFRIALTKVKPTGKAAEEYASPQLNNTLYI
jgi:hypothetical protein